ncbi:cell wall anchor domain-containing protein [Limosilactobacillus reuteri I5007]|uniref:Cell wall anchor domain-containing protein n=1 Tax=Limosilactobacillus reuteri I5007 TaxID=1340495 RepID=R9WH30_LIMRT|nr:amidase family protein [Limosilactobacillus reuteri]AGN99316.1 cell wall anchor domain-containing protein [Limosilactobacillus reuteri I5007]UCN16775.1 LPXTG cell wall anchor domain-containing protein [Limosilactobacillus reuteri]UCN18546.1 LPXTG cell wall anchor domain-containing protein [Limosilactobacillus reuteri]
MKKHWKLRFTLSLLVPLGLNLFYSLPTHASEEAETNIQTDVKVDAQSSKTIKDDEDQSALAIAQQVKNQQIDSQQLVNDTYQKIAENKDLNSVIYQDPVNARQQVNALPDTNTNSEQPFYGVPILIKGLGQAYKEYPNTNGLPYMQDNRYGYTKNFVAKLQKMGFVIVGETNYPELGLINVTDSNLYGPAHNPWDLTRNAGGSSGGAAASVAAGIVPIATGNDAGGSLRIPASWSGVIGLKPTQGIILGDSLTPSVVNFAETRRIDDTIKLFEGLLDPKRKSLLKEFPLKLQDLKIAYSLKSPVGSVVSADAKAAVLNAVTFLRQQGFQVVEKDSPVDGVKLMRAYYLGALSDGTVANYLAQQKLHRNLQASDVTEHLVSPMTYALYEASKKAPKETKQIYNNELALVAAQMKSFHEEYPIYLTPTTATVAPLNSDPAFLPADVAKILQIDKMPFDQQIDVIYNAWYHGLSKTPFTQLANLAGEPALSLPTYVNAQGLPLGIQLEGEKGSDLILLALGKLFEEKGKLIFLSNYQKLDNAAQPSEPQNEDAVSISKVVVHNLGEKAVYEFQTIPSKLNFSDNVSPKYAVRTSKQVNARKLQSIKEKQLPQTGSNNNDGLVLLGLALFPLSLTSVYQNKRKF